MRKRTLNCFTRPLSRLCLFSAVLCASIAQGQTPPAPAAQQKSEPAPAIDAMELVLTELKQPVSLQCVDTPLSDILADLQKQSGVMLKADPAWVGGMPVTSFTNPMPLGTMLKRLADLYHLSWRQSPLPAPKDTESNASVAADTAKPTLILYESAANRRDIERLKRLSWDPARARAARTRHYAGLTDEQLARMAKEGDGDAQAMLNPIKRAGVRLLGDVSEDMIDALIDKEPKGFTFAQLSPRAQDSARILIQDQNERGLQSWKQAKARGDDSVANTSAPVAIAPEECSVRYFLNGEGANARLHYELRGSRFPLQTASGIGGSAVDYLVWWRDWYERGKRTVSPAARAEVRKAPAKAVFDMTTWADALRVIHDRWKVNVFSDAYPEQSFSDNHDRPRPQTYPAGTPLTDSLTIGSAWNRIWWQTGAPGTDILHLRNDWYNQRDDGSWYAVHERLTQMKKDKQPLTLEEWTRMATLSTERLNAAGETWHLPVAGGWSTSKRPLLQFYAALSPLDRPRLWNGGLAPSTLDLASQHRLLQAVQAINAHATEDWLRDVKLCLKTAYGASEFYFKTQDADNPLAACRWTLDGVPDALKSTAGGIQPIGITIK